MGGDQAAYLQEGPTTEGQKQEVRDAAEDVGIVRHPLLRVGDERAEPPSLSAAGGKVYDSGREGSRRGGGHDQLQPLQDHPGAHGHQQGEGRQEEGEKEEQEEEFDSEEEPDGDDKNVARLEGGKEFLKQEFVNAAYQSFLAGKDPGLDYAQIDADATLDDLDAEELEQQEKYFDESDENDE